MNGINFRPYQKEIIKATVKAFFEKDYKNVIVEAGTGFGKSLVNYLIAKYFWDKKDMETWYSTPQVVLLEQLEKDQLIRQLGGIAVIKGRDKYICPISKTLEGEELPCNLAPCVTQKFFTCKNKQECPYYQARDIALTSPISALSFAFLLSTKDIEDWGQRDLLIVDEADDLESWAIEYGTLKFRVTNRYFDNIHQIIRWAKTRLSNIRTKINFLENMEKLTPNMVAMLENLKKQEQKLTFFLNDAQDNPHNWTWKQSGTLLELKPIDAGIVLNKTIWWRGKYRLITSATVINAELFKKYTGLKGKTLFIRVPHPIPPENRPVYIHPVGKMTKEERANTYDPLVKAIEEIAEKHKGQNGIIHANSYEIAQEIARRLQLKGFKVITHNSDDRNEKFQEFLNSKDPSVFIAVGFERGIDLKYDLCRWQIITKCFTEDVEVLTPEGLKPVKDLKVGDKVISYNIKTGKLEIDEIVRIYKEHYKGKIIRFTGETFDVKVTPDHTMIGAKRKRINGKQTFTQYKKYKAYELINSYTKVPISGEYSAGDDKVCLWNYIDHDEIIRANSDKSMPHKLKKYAKLGLIRYYPKYEPNNRCYEFTKDITNSNYELAKKIFGSLYYKGKYRQSKTHPIEFDAGDFLELCGWYISEGSAYEYEGKKCGNTKAGKTYKIVLHQKKHKDRIINLLKRLNIPFKVYNDRIVIHSYLIYKVFTTWFGKGAKNKHISHEILFKYSSKHLKRMFNAMILGDGTVTKKGSVVYYTSSNRLVDDVRILARLTGMAVTKVSYRRGTYEIYFTQKPYSYITKDRAKTEYYDGTVYCPTVKNNGTVIAGINGKLIITGNCPYPDQSDPRVHELWVKRKNWKWARYCAIKSLVQACGRAIRSPDDYAATYILDSSINHLLKYKSEFPKWFLDAIVHYFEI